MENSNLLHDGHRERLRLRIQNEPTDRLEPHELLEFLLYFSIPRQDVNALAHQLLEAFGSFRAILNATEEEIARVEGIGLSTANWIYRIGCCAKVCEMLLPSERILLNNYAKVFDFARITRSLVDGTCCIQLCMDADSCLIYRNRICSGDQWTEPEAIHAALSDMISTKARNSILLLVCSDSSRPSEHDISCAEKYAFMLHELHCSLLDMIFVSPGDLKSLRHMGKIPEFTLSTRMKTLQDNYIHSAPDLAAEDSGIHSFTSI